MSSRAGYTVSVYVLDVSPSMGTLKADPGNTGVKATKLQYAKEYLARLMEPRVSRESSLASEREPDLSWILGVVLMRRLRAGERQSMSVSSHSVAVSDALTRPSEEKD
jgi:ATP-dependent DNA helicase 2 subunit 2